MVHLNALDQQARCSPRQPTRTVRANPPCSLWGLTGCRLSAICGNNVRTMGKEGFEAISIHTGPRLTCTPDSSVMLHAACHVLFAGQFSRSTLGSHVNKEGNPFSMPPGIPCTADVETDYKMPSFVEEAIRFRFVPHGSFPIIPSGGGKVSALGLAEFSV